MSIYIIVRRNETVKYITIDFNQGVNQNQTFSLFTDIGFNRINASLTTLASIFIHIMPFPICLKTFLQFYLIVTNMIFK